MTAEISNVREGYKIYGYTYELLYERDLEITEKLSNPRKVLVYGAKDGDGYKHFEVRKAVWKESGDMTSKYKPYWKMASTGQWGIAAWTIMTLDRAIEKADSLT